MKRDIMYKITLEEILESENLNLKQKIRELETENMKLKNKITYWRKRCEEIVERDLIIMNMLEGVK